MAQLRSIKRTPIETAGIVVSCCVAPFIASGCWAVAAGAGAEAGYVAAQEDRTASETVNDQRITSLVKTRLLADPEVSGLDINVDTFKSQVTLRGFVENQSEASRAIELAQSVSGVKGVRSQLKNR